VEPSGRWVILIEETAGSGQAMRWNASLGDSYYPDRETARRAALSCARGYSPRHPMSPKTRSVVRHDEDSYTVIIEGATTRFHFRVSVGEHIE
jgi:hypothetical protein